MQHGDRKSDAVKGEPKTEESEDRLPSFGSTLDRFRAASSPRTRRLCRLLNDGESAETSNSKAIRDNDEVLSYNADLALVRGAIKAGKGYGSNRQTLSHHAVASPTSSANPSKSMGSRNASSASPDAKNDVSQSHHGGSPKRKKRKIADEGQFEGMQGIPDRLDHNLDILFCGINPGVRSSQDGFHYAHPSNRFYRILHESGLTPYRLKPSESPDMPRLYKLGLTDLVLRCTARADQVSSLEFQAGATGLLRKMMKYRPKLVCFVGMDVYRNFRKHFGNLARSAGQSPSKPTRGSRSTPSPSKARDKAKQSKSDVQLGLQDLVISVPDEEALEGKPEGRGKVHLFVIPSTSGLAAGYSDAQRIAHLQDARAAVATLRAGQDVLLESGQEVLLQAEDYLTDKVVKLESGEWSYVSQPLTM